jgi:hypothetical protein
LALVLLQESRQVALQQMLVGLLPVLQQVLPVLQQELLVQEHLLATAPLEQEALRVVRYQNLLFEQERSMKNYLF